MSGGNGRVGRLLAPYGVVDLGCDVTNPIEVQRSIRQHKPDIIVHLACHSDVNWCEKNVDVSIKVNFVGASNVATDADRYGIPVVILSSDHVFDGKKWWGKYKENDSLNPLNMYGMTKTSAEGLQGVFDNIKVVRTSYLFDYPRVSGEITLMKHTASHKEYSLYPSFLKRSFMYAPHFVESLWYYLSNLDKMPNILHISGNVIASWHQFMSMLANKCGLDMARILPRKNDEENGYAPRGHRLGLDVSLSAKLRLPQFDYLDGINQMLEDNG